MVGGSYYYAEERKKRKVFDETVAERKSMERKEAWIRELEIRDQEEKALQAKKDAVAKTRAEKLAKSALETADTRRLGVIEAVKDLPWS